jgi:hypothetical protein
MRHIKIQRISKCYDFCYDSSSNPSHNFLSPSILRKLKIDWAGDKNF